jgi:adenylate kinase
MRYLVSTWLFLAACQTATALVLPQKAVTRTLPWGFHTKETSDLNARHASKLSSVPRTRRSSGRLTFLPTRLSAGTESLATRDPIRLIIAGAPASGKGTQCEKIKNQYGIVHLSTGDMLREAVAAGTTVGKQAKGAC